MMEHFLSLISFVSGLSIIVIYCCSIVGLRSYGFLYLCNVIYVSEFGTVHTIFFIWETIMLYCLLNKSEGHEHDYQILVYIDVQSLLFVSLHLGLCIRFFLYRRP